jgi:hypothetical protein
VPFFGILPFATAAIGEGFCDIYMAGASMLTLVGEWRMEQAAKRPARN